MQTAIRSLPRWVYPVGLTAVVFHLAVGATLFRLQRDDHRITGTMTVYNDIGSYGFTSAADGEGCEGTNGYDDIHQGTQVTVSDSSGKTIGVGTLGIGRRDDISCTFEFSVPDIPDADFYKIEVARRGGLSYSKQELASKGWHVEHALGQ